jgi:hypothetical protein
MRNGTNRRRRSASSGGVSSNLYQTLSQENQQNQGQEGQAPPSPRTFNARGWRQRHHQGQGSEGSMDGDAWRAGTSVADSGQSTSDGATTASNMQSMVRAAVDAASKCSLTKNPPLETTSCFCTAYTRICIYLQTPCLPALSILSGYLGGWVYSVRVTTVAVSPSLIRVMLLAV